MEIASFKKDLKEINGFINEDFDFYILNAEKKSQCSKKVEPKS